jgi:hypothetical protein
MIAQPTPSRQEPLAQGRLEFVELGLDLSHDGVRLPLPTDNTGTRLIR